MSPTPFVPNSLPIFQAAFSGALAGMGASNRQPNDTDRTDPVNVGVALCAGAFAQAFDEQWGTSPTSQLDVESTQEVCAAAWWGRAPQASVPTNVDPDSYLSLADALVALVDAGDDYFASIGVVPSPVPVPPPPPPPVLVSNGIIWRPGVPSAGNVVATWPEVQAAVDAANGAIVVYVDSSIANAFIPAGTWKGYGAVRLATLGKEGFHVTIQNGATLVDYAAIDGVVVQCACVTAPSFSFSDNLELLLVNFAVITLASAAAVPAMQVGNGFAMVSFLGTLDNGNAPTVPVVQVEDGALATFYPRGAFNFDFLITGNEIGGSALATVAWNNDSTVAPLASTLFLGIIQNNGSSLAQWTGYTPSVPGNWVTPPTQVAQALDELAAKESTEVGITALVFRPGGVPGGNVYTTEDTLATASQAFNGAPYSILWDLSLVGGNYTPTTVGSWALGANGIWDDGSKSYHLMFANGTTLPFPPLAVIGSFNPTVAQGVDVCTVAAGVEGYTEFRNTAIGLSAAGGKAFINAAGNWDVFVKDTVQIESTVAGGSFFVATGATGVINVILEDTAFIGLGGISAVGGGKASVIATSPSAVADASLNPILSFEGLYVDLFGGGTATIPATGTTAGALLFSGGVLYQSNGVTWLAVPSNATTDVYNAANVVNWSGVNPTSVASALDRIAAAIGPIPV